MDIVRKRMQRRERDGGARYLTFSCYKRIALFGTPAMRDLMARSIASARIWCEFQLLAWVVMPEHVHLMILPNVRAFTVDAISHRIKQPVAMRAIDRWRELDAAVLPKITTPGGRVQFWQSGGGFDRNPRDGWELLREIKYIHQNPVKRGLVERPVDWPWSSARWYAGERTGVVTVDELPPGAEWMMERIVSGLEERDEEQEDEEKGTGTDVRQV
jgi:putative transposase